MEMVMVSVLINSEKKHHHSPYSLENENAAFGKSSSLFL
jgi:hypothetical protein